MASCAFWADTGRQWLPCTHPPQEGSRYCSLHHTEREWAQQAIVQAQAIQGPWRAAQIRAAAENWARLCRVPPPTAEFTQQRTTAEALARGTLERQATARTIEAQVRREVEAHQREQDRRAAEREAARTLARIEAARLPARFVPPPPDPKVLAKRRALEAKRQAREAKQRAKDEQRRAAAARRQAKRAAALADLRRRAEARLDRAAARARLAALLAGPVHLTDEDCWAQSGATYDVAVDDGDADYREATYLFRAGAVTHRPFAWVSPRWDRLKEGKPSR